jgi:hypothetical protein
VLCLLNVFQIVRALGGPQIRGIRRLREPVPRSVTRVDAAIHCVGTHAFFQLSPHDALAVLNIFFPWKSAICKTSQHILQNIELQPLQELKVGLIRFISARGIEEVIPPGNERNQSRWRIIRFLAARINYLCNCGADVWLCGLVRAELAQDQIDQLLIGIPVNNLRHGSSQRLIRLIIGAGRDAIDRRSRGGAHARRGWQCSRFVGSLRPVHCFSTKCDRLSH